MPNRRNVLIGLGGLMAGGGALIGTGAFTTVEAERTVTVNTAGDASALLGLDEAGAGVDSGVVDVTDGTLEINFDDASDSDAGVNLNAKTTVGNVSSSSVNTAALTISNNGTQTIDISFNIGFDSNQSGLGNPGDILKLWTDANGQNATINSTSYGNLVANDLIGLQPGNSVSIALQIDTVGLTTTDIDTSNPLFESNATITATSQ